MVGNKAILAVVIGLAAINYFQLSKIYVPDSFEKPFAYKIKVSITKAYKNFAVFAAKLGISTEIAIFRRLAASSTHLMSRLETYATDVEESKIAGIPVRFYIPKTKPQRPRPAMIFIHGGGYVIGDLDTYNMFLSTIADRTGLFIISIDYKMSPENPFPKPVDECFDVTKYVFENYKKFNIDINRIVMAGDSAGGNAVGLITQRIAKYNLRQPKLQILIYPWTQMYTMSLPSAQYYATRGFLSTAGLNFVDFNLWLCGITNITNEMREDAKRNQFTLPLKDEALKKKYLSYLDIELIPEEYKKGREYYVNYKRPELKNTMQLTQHKSPLSPDATKVFDILRSPLASPGLANDDDLKGLPKAYFIILEWDSLKDEGLIYAERLRRNGVPVKIAFYENAYHGMLTFLHGPFGHELSRSMLNDLIDYLQRNV